MDCKWERLIRDAELRVGSYIVGGGHENDQYVKDQIAKIKDWYQKWEDEARCQC